MSQGKDDAKAKPKDEKVSSPTAEQDSRVAKGKAEAEAKGGGAGKPEKGLNQDG